jgi:hypothetical protein
MRTGLKSAYLIHSIRFFYYYFGATNPQLAMASSFTRFLDHTRRTTVGRIPLDEWLARRWDLYMTTQNTHNRQTSMPPVGFEPTIAAGERPQTYALESAATGTGHSIHNTHNYKIIVYIYYTIYRWNHPVKTLASSLLVSPVRCVHRHWWQNSFLCPRQVGLWHKRQPVFNFMCVSWTKTQMTLLLLSKLSHILFCHHFISTQTLLL